MTEPTPFRVGLIGCGNISGQYLSTLARLPGITVAACADIDPERAAATAREHAIPLATGVDELLADPGIDAVVNLTIPAVHATVTRAAIAAGKHVWSEKPLALDRADVDHIRDEAARAGVRVGCAPDTFLGAGLQTSIQAIVGGAIGRPVAATAFFTTPGPEAWHPDPEFFYAPGGGPLLDIGVYPITALVAIFGAVESVTAQSQRSVPTRTIGSGVKAGQEIPVEVATHYSVSLNFADGGLATLVTSFDVPAHELPHLEVYGVEGTITLPDPNGFGGNPRVRRRGEDEWTTLAHTSGYLGFQRGIGLAELADAIAAGVGHRASLDFAAHVLDTMLAIDESAAAGRESVLRTGCEKPSPVGKLIGG
ncbi:Gfo/Idh/MocA family oxidoreductase [Phytomonospora sp. NPDC050363]|uniref:Gfo/Idh/MocA family protein n=1 Tax=Phytomonospora sp. NPDC050363 TaxID=3155642 RepID=UPI0033C5C4B9